MCGRFTLTLLEEDLKRRFRIQKILAEFLPRYNIAPSQKIPVIIKNEENENVLTTMRWGLIPGWAKDEKIGYKMINARVETISQKPSFKQSFQKRRCLIPADGFYEWKKEGKSKTPLRVTLKSQEVFAFAGLWDRWKNPDGNEIESCTIITCEANEFMKQIHDRMPVILKKEAEDMWLDSELEEMEKLRNVLVPYPSDRLRAYQVSKIVNSTSNEIIDCIQDFTKT